MAQHSGFFNALKTDRGYDRKYNANDYSSNMGAIISNGVRRSGDNDLRVTTAGGMGLAVAVGRAWIEGRWYWNDTVYTEFTVPTAPAGDMSRIDRVVLRLNTEIAVKEIKLFYLTGAPSTSPTAPALTRSGNIYELALADIKVGSGVTSISQADITDQRANKEVCGWITTPVGYDDFFENFNAEFNEWFTEKKNKLASTTLFKRYHQRIVVENQTTTVDFNIPQYDPTGVDIIDVFVNGVHQVVDVDFTATKSVITFTNAKIAGSEIDVYVYRSIDGTGLGGVSDELTAIQNQLATVKNIGEYLYICNGVDDNVKISEILTNFFNGSGDANAQLTLNVYGTFGVSVPYSGSGTSVSRYRWFNVGSASATSRRRATIDFLNSSPINLTGEAGKHYIGFYGGNITIKNATVVARQRNTEGSIVLFVGSNGNIKAENCRFDLSAMQDSYIADRGTFVDCIGSVTNSRGNSYCFSASSKSVLRVTGGTYYAYTGLSSSKAAVFGTGSLTALDGGPVFVVSGVNMPVKAKASHYQKSAVECDGFSKGSFTGLITNLTITKTSYQTVSGTANVSIDEDGDTYF